MDEAKVKEIHTATVLSQYSHQELRDADQWVKDFALAKLEDHLKAIGGLTAPMIEYVTLMARCHYGSVETDQFLMQHCCYPEWLS